jgi:hypothetical protein
MSGVFVVADENAAAGRRKDRDRVDEFDAGLGTGSERTAWIFSEVVSYSVFRAREIGDALARIAHAHLPTNDREYGIHRWTSGDKQRRGRGCEE